MMKNHPSIRSSHTSGVPLWGCALGVSPQICERNIASMTGSQREGFHHPLDFVSSLLERVTAKFLSEDEVIGTLIVVVGSELFLPTSLQVA